MIYPNCDTVRVQTKHAGFFIITYITCNVCIMSEIFVPEDFETVDVKQYKQKWGLSNESMKEIQRWMVGEPVHNVEDRWMTDEALNKAGWASMKYYQICSAIRHF